MNGASFVYYSTELLHHSLPNKQDEERDGERKHIDDVEGDGEGDRADGDREIERERERDPMIARLMDYSTDVLTALGVRVLI